MHTCFGGNSSLRVEARNAPGKVVTNLPLGWRLEMHLVKIRPLGWRLEIHHDKLVTILPLRWRLELHLCFGGNLSLRVEARIAHLEPIQSGLIYSRNQALASKHKTWALSVIKCQV